MNYQNLARRYRPKKFDQMIGQPHVLTALSNAINSNRIHHAYIFTGTRGVGKTTVARIFAKCLNCANNISVEPCESCTSCREINESRCIDLIEIDAASRTKVEDTRELLANVQYAPVHSRFKIYLIDEVHMLSLQSFNALLKTLEEPPEHVKFLLATTDPQKIPITILSRCLQFNLKRMSEDTIGKYVSQVLQEENILYEAMAVEYIAKVADGSMRDALSITDQAIAYTNGNLKNSDVARMLGSVDKEQLIEILYAVANKQAATVIELTRSLAEESPDFTLVLDDLLTMIHNLALMQVDDNRQKSNTDKSLINLAATISAEDLQLFYQFLIAAKKDLVAVSDANSVLDMALLRMIAFAPNVKKSAYKVTQHSNNDNKDKQQATTAIQNNITPKTNENSDQLVVKEEHRNSSINELTVINNTTTADCHRQTTANTVAEATKKTADKVAATSALNNNNCHQEKQQAIEAIQTKTPVTNIENDKQAAEAYYNNINIQETKKNGTLLQDNQPTVATQNTHINGQSVTITADNWPKIFYKLDLQGMEKTIAANFSFVSYQPRKLKLCVAKDNADLLNNLDTQKLSTVLSALTKQKIDINIIISEHQNITPYEWQINYNKAILLKATHYLANDEKIKKFIHCFDAKLLENTIQII